MSDAASITNQLDRSRLKYVVYLQDRHSSNSNELFLHGESIRSVLSRNDISVSDAITLMIKNQDNRSWRVDLLDVGTYLFYRNLSDEQWETIEKIRIKVMQSLESDIRNGVITDTQIEELSLRFNGDSLWEPFLNSLYNIQSES